MGREFDLNWTGKKNVYEVQEGQSIQAAVRKALLADGWALTDATNTIYITFDGVDDFAEGDYFTVTLTQSGSVVFERTYEIDTDAEVVEGRTAIDCSVSGLGTFGACEVIDAQLDADLDEFGFAVQYLYDSHIIINSDTTPQPDIAVEVDLHVTPALSENPGTNYEALMLTAVHDDGQNRVPRTCVVVNGGDYTEDLQLAGNLRMYVNGRVNLTGSISSDTSLVGCVIVGDMQISVTKAAATSIVASAGDALLQLSMLDDDSVHEGLRIGKYGQIKVRGNSYGRGAFVDQQNADGRGTLHDRPLPPPRYTDKKFIVAITFDDCLKAMGPGGTTTYSELDLGGGALTPYEYLLAKLIPISWGVVGDWITSGAGMSTAELNQIIQKCGGAADWHSKTHATSTKGVDERAVDEIPGGIAAIEAGCNYPVRAGVYAGPYSPGVDPTTLGGLMVRESFEAYRASSSTGNEGSMVMPVASRIPIMGRRRWDSESTTPKGALPAAYVSNLADIVERLVEMSALSEGHAIYVMTHTVMDDDNVPGYGMCVSVFKAMCDALATARDAGTCEIVPLAQFVRMHPTYVPNLILNPGFEHSEIQTYDLYWSDANYRISDYSGVKALRAVTAGSSTIALDAVAYHGGAQSLKLTRDGGTCDMQWNYMTVIPGDQYRFEVWTKGDAAQLDVIWNADTAIQYSIAAAGDWAKSVFYLTAPNDRYLVSLKIRPAADATAVNIDDLFLG